MELLDDFQRLWDAGDTPPDVFEFLKARGELDAEQSLAILRFDQQRRWRYEHPLRVEDYLERLPPPNGDDVGWKFQLAVGEFEARRQTNRPASIEEFSDRFPDLSDRLREVLSTHGGDDEATLDTRPPVRTDDSFSTTSFEFTLPSLGRYRLLRVLGEGAFGRVYLAYDEQLERQVAIKVPTAERFQRPEDAETYLAEARTVAALDHPHIVTVHDVGRAPDGSPYVVSQYIEGGTLADRIRRSRPTPDESARVLSAIAGALDYAHRRRLIHRDVKPANILIEQRGGDAFLTDFGLAIREEDVFKNPALAGTPGYMSPEQARGEGHRLDGRSDIFSLGVVLYELLTSRKPFRGSTANEIFHQIISLDPPSPRQVDENVPAELERICHKALAKQASDRYADAAAMADDLANWNTALDTTAAARTIVPKGLRSFDADDADFFIDLLPGPRSRFGLPESLQFWKTRIEQQDAEQTFACGLIYGPSGCGKSSLVKAGLLPRLADDIKAVYLEATPEETELRLMRGIRKQHPELPENLTLVEALATLRRRSGGKTVLVLDQFEQWLHARGDYAATELVAALRQCDGGRLQVIALVRDDFAMAAARFMDAMDIPIVQGHNFATVDLFDIDHARKVLARFGEAFGKLPRRADQWSDQQRAFVDQAAEALAVDGKVVSVRLSLFAEMVKAKPWTPETLKAVGGAEGVGVNFLEETFSSREANPAHRLHQEAARQVLRALLPEVGAEIKGHMRSHDELLIASGYANRPRDFAALLRILDGELRLITPTDPMGADSVSRDAADAQYYQLTHDYLVPSLRRWLTAKQRETRRGRAELLLEERAALWNAKPETRFLPSLTEWVRIGSLTDRRQWSEGERKMIRRATRFHALRTGAVVALVALVSLGGLAVRKNVLAERQRLAEESREQQNRTSAQRLVESLVTADTAQVPEIVRQLDEYRQWADPLLETNLAEAEEDSTAKLHLSLARVADDDSRVDYLFQRLLNADPSRIPVIVDALAPQADTLKNDLWDIVTAADDDPASRRLRAAAALAKYDPQNGRWHDAADEVARQLVAVSPVYLRDWMQMLRPVGDALLRPLAQVFRDGETPPSQRALATEVLAEFAADRVEMLVDLLQDADEQQFAVIFPRVSEHGSAALKLLEAGMTQSLEPGLRGKSKLAYARRQAAAAIALLRQGEREKIFGILRVGDDPESLTQFVHRCRQRGVTPAALWDCVQLVDQKRQGLRGETRQTQDQVLYGLLLALGEFTTQEVRSDVRQPLVDRLAAWFRDDPSSTILAASGWLLRHWGESELVAQIEETEVPYAAGREWFRLVIPVEDQRFVQTYIVFEPGVYEIGSPPDAADRRIDETRSRVRLTRTFAILDREVTRGEFELSRIASLNVAEYSPTTQHPMVAPNWYDTVRFCRWLTAQSGLPESEQCYFDPQTLDTSRYPPDTHEVAGGAPQSWPFDFARRGFRLPTEAEWEVAARSRVRTAYGFGDDPGLLAHYAWFLENSGRQTQVPRQLRPNFRGLFDMHGNVWNWCHDWYGGYHMLTPVTDPVGPPNGSSRVDRGGSWSSVAANCRLASRGTSPPTDRHSYNGMRLALSPSGQVPEAKE